MLLPDPEPREASYLLISVDDHVIEPANMFEGRMPSDLADKTPRLVDYQGGLAWVLEDLVLPNFGLNAVAGRPPEEWDDEPHGWDDMRRGCWQIDAWISDMDINGIYASVCFPSRIAGFGGARFAEVKDQALGLACVRAWNDWHLALGLPPACGPITGIPSSGRARRRHRPVPPHLRLGPDAGLLRRHVPGHGPSGGDRLPPAR